MLTSTTLFSPQDGNTALDYAKEKGYSKIVELIEAKQKPKKYVPPFVFPHALANQGVGEVPKSRAHPLSPLDSRLDLICLWISRCQKHTHTQKKEKKMQRAHPHPNPPRVEMRIFVFVNIHWRFGW